MATVFNNSMVAHVWASGSQQNGRSNNGNFFFEGRTLYSYGSHFVVGYRLRNLSGAGDIFLLTGDSYSISTAKHKNDAWHAVPGSACRIASLTRLRGILAHATSDASQPDTLTRRRGYLPQIKAFFVDHPSSEESMTRILAAFGQRDASRAAAAIVAKVDRAEKAAKEKAAKKKRESELRMAKYLAETRTPEVAAAAVRDLLAKACDPDESSWRREDAEREAREEARETNRAKLAAKKAGWTRIHRALLAQHRAQTAEIRKLERGRELYRRRAMVRKAIATIRKAPDAMAQNPANHANCGGAEFAYKVATSRANLWEVVRAAFVTLTESPYAKLVCNGHRMANLLNLAAQAYKSRAKHQKEANLARVEMQKEARAEFYATGKRGLVPGGGQLSCKFGGALLRAADVERDESGKITGGTLQTSWGATVPLTHAVKAFRFLKLCRQMSAENPDFDGWKANGKTIRVGHFRVDSVDATGSFKAGCHKVFWPEVARLAAELGVFGLDPDDAALEPSYRAA